MWRAETKLAVVSSPNRSLEPALVSSHAKWREASKTGSLFERKIGLSTRFTFDLAIGGNKRGPVLCVLLGVLPVSFGTNQ